MGNHGSKKCFLSFLGPGGGGPWSGGGREGVGVGVDRSGGSGSGEGLGGVRGGGAERGGV